MNNTILKPTKEFYDLFDFMHQFLNKRLFTGQLSPVMIVITRKKSFGHYSHKRWVNNTETKSDEIAIRKYTNQYI